MRCRAAISACNKVWLLRWLTLGHILSATTVFVTHSLRRFLESDRLSCLIFNAAFCQVVRCAVLKAAKEAGGRHIELSLRSSVVNKGLSLSQLSTGSGVYGTVASVEDHGYVVSLGLEGVAAFLPMKDATTETLKAGQPVETVIKVHAVCA